MIPSSSFINSATGSIMEQFQYFARPIIIYKQPTETIVNTPNSNPLYGYDSISQTTNSEITLTAESQTFSGLLIYPLKSRGQSNATFDNKIILSENSTYLKVLPECFNYINNGVKTEKVEVDGVTWNIGDKVQPARYLGLQFYYIELKETN